MIGYILILLTAAIWFTFVCILLWSGQTSKARIQERFFRLLKESEATGDVAIGQQSTTSVEGGEYTISAEPCGYTLQGARNRPYIQLDIDGLEQAGACRIANDAGESDIPNGQARQLECDPYRGLLGSFGGCRNLDCLLGVTKLYELAVSTSLHDLPLGCHHRRGDAILHLTICHSQSQGEVVPADAGIHRFDLYKRSGRAVL